MSLECNQDVLQACAPHAGAGIRQWLGLAVLALPTLLLGLDATLLYLALPALAADLAPSSTQVLWIMDIYGFMIAGLLITMGTLGDRIGRRRLLMLGATAFGAASVLAACSSSAEMLILARAALGIAGATLMPSTLALISNLFTDPRQRAQAIGIWATMFALGMAIGPLVGGLLLERFGWRAGFLLALPVVALLLAFAPFLLPEYRAPRHGRFDLPSVALSLAAILPTIHGMKEIARHEAMGGALTLLVGLGFAVWFVRRQQSLATPLLDIRLFTNRAFSTALVVLLVALVAVGGAMLLISQYLQLVLGLTPLAAGMWLAPPALAMVLAGLIAPLLARHIRPGFVVSAALALSALGYLLLAQLDQLPWLVAGLALIYFGLGTIAALGTELVIAAAPIEKTGAASAMSEMVQELGVALGVATLGSLVANLYRRGIAEHITPGLPQETAQAIGEGLWIAPLLLAQIPDTLLEQARSTFTEGLSVAVTASALVIAALAIAAAVALRHVRSPG